MPRCGCADACSCLIVPGEGISVEGIGTLENPYQITSESADLTGRIEFTDEGNVDFTTTGVGTLNDPTTVFADALLAVQDLTDVPDTDPAEGQVLVWRTDHWEFEDQTGSGGGGVPPGGLTGEVLTKLSDSDGDADWEPIVGGGGGAVVEPVYSSSRGHTLATSISSNVHTSIPFNTEQWTDGIPWSTDSFTIPVAGYYHVHAVGTVAMNATGFRAISIVQNSTYVDTTQVVPVATTGTGMSVAATVKAVAGDLISVRIYQNSGVALGLAGGPNNNYVAITKVPALQPGGGGVVVERPVVAARRHAAGTSILNATVTTVPWDSEVYTDGLSWDAGQAAWVAPSDGYYDIEGALTYLANTVGDRRAYLYVGGVVQSTYAAPAAPAGINTTVTFAGTVKALAGQTIQVRTYQSSGATLAMVNSSSFNYVSVTKSPQAYAGSAVSTYGERNYAASRGQQAAFPSTSGVVTPIPFDTLTNEDGITMESDGRFLVPVAGFYAVELLVSYGAAPGFTGVRGALITINGGAHTSAVVTPNAASQTTTAVATQTIKLAAGDGIRGCTYQTSGVSPLNTAGGAAYTRISIHKVPAPVVNGAAASGVWGVAPLDAEQYGTDDLLGREVYIDSRGQLRARPEQVGQHLPTELAAAWPAGTSIYYIPGADAALWPGGSQVVTHKTSNNVIAQWCYLWSSTTSRAWYRNGTNTGWAPWVETASDTGWLACTVGAAGWTQPSPLQARRMGRQCYIRGRLQNASFMNVGHAALGQLPAGVGIPAQSTVFPIGTYGATAHNRSFQIDSVGSISVGSSLASTNYYDFTGSWVISDGSV